MSETSSFVIATYTKITTKTISSEASVSGAVGKGYDTTSAPSSNAYSSGSSDIAEIKYTFDFSSIPASATVKSIRCRIKGKCESTSNVNEHMDCQLYAGNVAKGEMKAFKSLGHTSFGVLDLVTGTWTRAELDTLSLNVKIGFYGGVIAGATIDVTYDVGGISIKVNGNWVSAQHVYRKNNGSWQEVTDLSQLDSTKNWVRGD